MKNILIRRKDNKSKNLIGEKGSQIAGSSGISEETEVELGIPGEKEKLKTTIKSLTTPLHVEQLELNLLYDQTN